FLDAMITPRPGSGNTFCQSLRGIIPNQSFDSGTLNVDDSKLRRFLDGHIFFNHFIRIEVKLNFPMLIHAWNRGAAIMCKTGSKGIDFVIPVVLKGGPAVFGPLHDGWTDQQCKTASTYISYILINSKNYEHPKTQFAAAWEAKLSKTCFEPRGTLNSDQI